MLTGRFIAGFAGTFLLVGVVRAADSAPPGSVTFKSSALPSLKNHCVKCHAPEKSKGEITLRTLGDLSGGHGIKQWELILEMLESVEVPPEDEPQPSEFHRKAVTDRIKTGLPRRR